MRNNYFFKRMLGYSLLLFCAAAGNAQTPLQLQSGSFNSHSKQLTNPTPSLGDFCKGTVLSKNIRQVLGTDEAYNAIYQQGVLAAQNETGTNRAVKVLPTVVHVIYGNATENISDARVNAFIAAINAAFSQTNNQTGVRTLFRNVIGNPEIQFCLAKTDPNGNPTTGIVRKSTSLASFPIDDNFGDAPIKKLPNGSPTWNPQKYVNIWIVDIGWLANGGGTAGYAYLPGSFSIAPGSANAYLDGLVVDVNATFGSSQGDYSIGIHELGHYLGLPHPFPDGSSSCVEASGDGFTDTPPTNSATQTSQACSATITKCGNTVQTENFMDYQIHCHQMFTLQQANYMNNTVLNPTSGFRRLLLWDGCTAAASAPVASFTGCNSSLAQNSTVTFTNTSTGNPTSYAWSITPATGWSYVGGTSATSQNPQIQFTALGTYSVSLTATNAQGSNVSVSSSCITVVAAGACNNLNTPLIMGFEANEDLTGWTVENTNNDVSGTEPINWGLFSTANNSIVANTGTGAIGYYYNEDRVTSANDWFFTPCLGLQPGTTYTLSFWHKIHASGGTPYPEKLRVRIGNTNTSAAMTQTIVDLGTLTNTNWVQSTTTFTVPAAGNYNVGFHCYSDADMFLLLVDDINISKPATTTPVANFTGCGTYTAGTTVTFTNTSTNSPTSNSWTITPATGWSFTGGTNANSTNPQVTFNTAGSYTVALTATNSAGSNTRTTSNCVVVTSSVSVPVANFTGCGNYTSGATVTFTNTSTNSPTSNSWTITPATGWSFTGGTNANSTNPQVTFNTAGSYTVALTATNSAGSNTRTTSNCVVVASTVSVPVANFTGCGNYTAGATVTFTNTSTNSPTSNSWSITPATGWSFTGGTNANSTNPQVTFNAAGNYTVALTATNSAGSNTKTTSNCVVVTPAVVAPVANFTGCGNYATGATVTFTNTSSNWPTSNSWSITPATGWSFTGGTNASSSNPQVTFNTAGNYTVALTATNSAGSDTRTSANCVVVSQPGSAPTAGFSGCGNYGVNSTVSFVNTSTGAVSYSWSISPSTGWVFTGGTGATSSNPQVIFTAAGSYSVTLTATNSIGSDIEISSNCISISTVTQPPSASFQGCPSADVAPGTTIQFANMSTGSPTSYLWEILPSIGWTFESGSNNTSTNPQVTFTGLGYYSVSLTATNSNGSSTSGNPSCVTVSANVGINENNVFGNVVLFPNPSAGFTTLSFGNTVYNNLKVSVYNAVGVKLYEISDSVPSELFLDFSAYSSGIYIIEIRSNEGISTKRFVLSR